MPVCAIYLRVSKEDQAGPNRLSLPAQERICRAVAEARGLEVGPVYVDDGASAFSDELASRPAFQQVLRDAPGEQFQVLLVYMLDRFARHMAGAQDWLRVLERAGVELLSATEWFDESPAGQFTRNLLLAQGQYFSQVLSRRVKDALAEKKRRGGFVGHIPYGYDGDGQGHLTVNEHEASGYRLAIKAVLDGIPSYSDIAMVLNAAGCRTKRNFLWSYRSVAYMLRNPAYLGMVPVGRRGERVLLPGAHPAMIDRETWERVQARCQAFTKFGGNPKRAKRPYPLSGVLYCARCGARLVGCEQGRTRYRWRCYRCGSQKIYHSCDLPRLKAETLEEIVAGVLDGLQLPPAWREQVLAAAQEEQPTGPSAESLAGEERRLTQLYQDGFLPYAEFKERWGKVQTKRKAATPPPVADALTLGELLDQGLGQLWRTANDREAQQQLARAVFAAIYVDWEKRATPRIARIEWTPALGPLRRIGGYLEEHLSQYEANPVPAEEVDL